MLFVCQAPLMKFSYAMICFLTGLAAVILGPLINRPRWGDDAKVSVFPIACEADDLLIIRKTAIVYLVAAVFASLSFVATLSVGGVRHLAKP